MRKNSVKLKLNPETLRALTYADLGRVAGGLPEDGGGGGPTDGSCDCGGGQICDHSVQKGNPAANSYRNAQTQWIYC